VEFWQNGRTKANEKQETEEDFVRKRLFFQ